MAVAWSGADICSAFAAVVRCRWPVWEFADRLLIRTACFEYVEFIWYCRPRLTTIAPCLPFDLPTCACRKVRGLQMRSAQAAEIKPPDVTVSSRETGKA